MPLELVTRGDVEQRICDLSSELIALKRRLNTYSPISKVPPEILLEIFRVIVNEWTSRLLQPSERFEAFTQHIPSYIWVPMTHVCHYWMKVAAQSSGFWSHIILNKHELVSMMLTRSRMVPVSLFYYVPREGGLDEEKQLRILDLLRPHLPRVKLLQVICMGPSNVLCGPLLSCHFPSIQTFTLQAYDLGPGQGNELHTKLADGWTNGEHRDLNRLTLHGVSFHAAQTAIRHSLKHLNMVIVPELVTLPKFLPVLESCPQLETLKVHWVIVQIVCPTGILPPPFTIITLPHLRLLEVSSFALSVVHFIRHLSFPSTARIDLHLNKLDTLDMAPDTLADYLAPMIPNGSRFISLKMWSSENPYFTLQGWLKEKVHNGTRPLFNIRLSDVTSHPSKIHLIITRLLLSTIAKLLNRLALDVDCIPEEYWKNAGTYQAITKKAPRLEYLEIASLHHTPHLLLPYDEAERKSIVPLPRLRFLAVHRMSEGEVQKLNDLLKKRHAHRRGIHTVKVPHTYDESMYKTTRKLVRSLRFDTHNVVKVG